MIDFTKYFEKVYVINLDKRPDRMDTFNRIINKFGITNIERFSGVDGSLIENDTKLLNGEVGILETHINIIKKCKTDNIDNVLILEDDVLFTDEISKIEEYLYEIPKNWDMIYLGGNHVYGLKPEKISDKIIKLNFTVALQSVAINKSVFDTILEILPNKNKQVDAYYADLHNTHNVYGFYPNMTKQLPGFSDIQNRDVDYANFFKD